MIKCIYVGIIQPITKIFTIEKKFIKSNYPQGEFLWCASDVQTFIALSMPLSTIFIYIRIKNISFIRIHPSVSDFLYP